MLKKKTLPGIVQKFGGVVFVIFDICELKTSAKG
jgi:hypothetical protein